MVDSPIYRVSNSNFLSLLPQIMRTPPSQPLHLFVCSDGPTHFIPHAPPWLSMLLCYMHASAILLPGFFKTAHSRGMVGLPCMLFISAKGWHSMCTQNAGNGESHSMLPWDPSPSFAACLLLQNNKLTKWNPTPSRRLQDC